MESAQLPTNEKARLNTLYEYEVLDTPSDPAFDDLTRLASQVCGVPIAVISFVDRDRQWFKSRIGLDAPETPRDIAFCAHAILQYEVFEVPDTALDSRFSDNPLVTHGPHIRFYAGATLVAPNGHPLGTICVIDRAPKVLTQDQKSALQALARQVVRLLEVRNLRTNFVKNINHEIRTPINGKIGRAHV